MRTLIYKEPILAILMSVAALDMKTAWGRSAGSGSMPL